MIDKMLMYAAKQGYSPSDIKEAVVKMLKPYFEHEEALNKYACDSQILSAFEFFVRYHYENEFAQGVKTITDYYKKSIENYSQESWDIILSTYTEMVEDENKMWSIRKNKIDLNEEDLYERMVQIFHQIGNILEVSAKHILQEIYGLIYLNNKGNVDYNKIKKQDFGVIIKSILDKNMLHSILKIEPSDLKLSDWRNIAYHHTYSIDDNGCVNCTYGRENQNKISISMEDLEKYLHKITRSCNILNIARCIFIFDYIDDVPKDKTLGKSNIRQAIRVEQFRISLLSQEFKLGSIKLGKSKVEIDLHDLLSEKEYVSRIAHCSQLLLNAWNVWEYNLVCINYISNDGNKICSVYVDGETCKSIYEGRKDVDYLANKFQYTYY